MNTWAMGFICGVAVSAVGMSLFSVPPAPQVSAAEKEAPALIVPPASQAAMPTDTSAVVAPVVNTVTAETPIAKVVEKAVLPAPAPIAASAVQRERGVSRTVTLPADRIDPARELSAAETSTIRFTGALGVQSRPSGARVFVGGTAVGTTPIVLRDLPVGSRVIRIEAEGYQTWSSSVRVIANVQTPVTATLYRQP
jgi:hypothetical protein